MEGLKNRTIVRVDYKDKTIVIGPFSKGYIDREDIFIPTLLGGVTTIQQFSPGAIFEGLVLRTDWKPKKFLYSQEDVDKYEPNTYIEIEEISYTWYGKKKSKQAWKLINTHQYPNFKVKEKVQMRIGRDFTVITFI